MSSAKKVTAADSLTAVSTDNLIDELAERLVKKNGEQNAFLKRQQELLLHNIDDLLYLTPGHSYSNCNDDLPCNSVKDPSLYPIRCVRCQLLHIKQNGYSDGLIAVVSLARAKFATEEIVEIRNRLFSVVT